jgi:hypothetical protein
MVAYFASVFSAAAPMWFLAYMANGIAAGAIIGLPEREMDVVVAQRHAGIWHVLCAVFQFGAAIAVFSILWFGAEADRFARLASRATGDWLDGWQELQTKLDHSRLVDEEGRVKCEDTFFSYQDHSPVRETDLKIDPLKTRTLTIDVTERKVALPVIVLTKWRNPPS